MSDQHIEIVSVGTYPSQIGHLDIFCKTYGIVDQMVPPDSKMSGFKEKGKRVCRFCGKKGDAKAFIDVAHLIPEALGNKWWHSDFECDACNERFSRYDNDLVNYIGIYRTFYEVRGKNRVPKFNSPSERITAQQENFYGVKSVTIEQGEGDLKAFNIDIETGKNEIVFKKLKYVPFSVYRSLLKIALSVLSEDSVKDYKVALKLLLDDNPDEKLRAGAKIIHYTLPFHQGREKPTVYLFRKLLPEFKIPTHFFVFFFRHMVFEFPIPFHIDDIHDGFYEKEQHKIPFCPPILTYKPARDEPFCSQILDLSSNEAVSGEEQRLSFQVDPAILKQMGYIDPATGKVEPATLTSEMFTKLIMVRGDQQPDFTKGRYDNPEPDKQKKK